MTTTSDPLTPTEALRITYAHAASAPHLNEDPELVADRSVTARYTAAQLAEEMGLAWPIRPELLDVATWAGRARWATQQRDTAIRAATAAGCPLRTVGQAAGLSHAGVARVLARTSRPATHPSG